MTNGQQDPASTAWHIDRRVPVSLIVTLLLAMLGQLLGSSIMFSQMQRSINENTKDIMVAMAQVQELDERTDRLALSVNTLVSDIRHTNDLLRVIVGDKAYSGPKKATQEKQ